MGGRFKIPPWCVHCLWIFSHPVPYVSKSMQCDNLDILGALTSLVRTVKETNKLSNKPLDQWPTYSSTVKKIEDQTGEPTYQCQELKKALTSKTTYFESKYAVLLLGHCGGTVYTNCSSKTARLAWSDFLTSFVTSFSCLQLRVGKKVLR